MAEGTADELKRQVAGDVITIGIDGDQERSSRSSAARTSSARPAPRTSCIRLYVDQGETAVPQLIRILDGAGLRARSLTLARPSLDDVFLRQTGRSLREEAAA